jgi:hypothetical protein
MIRRYHTEQNFFAGAAAMREAFDAHFRKPYEQSIQTHGVWNFWHVPGLYTFLRTDPERLIPRELIEAFVRQLRSWSLENLGTCASSPPQVHLYVDGCGQDLHSDFHNGLWAYVFSLTQWDQKRFSGGETLIFRDGNLNHRSHHVHGNDLYDLVPQNFNQLLVFDDSAVHGVRTLRGTTVPTEGRLVLTGHLMTTEPVVEGPLSVTLVKEWQRFFGSNITAQLRKYPGLRGWIGLGIHVKEDGSVESVSVRGNQLTADVEEDSVVSAAMKSLVEFLERSRFPPARSPSLIHLPLILPLPSLAPISIQSAHQLPLADVRSRLEQIFTAAALHSAWDGNRCQLSIPAPWCTGLLEVLPTTVILSVDLLMTRPSHRAALESRLTKLLAQGLQNHRAAS